ncbi:MAG TPA: hypothetical protein DCS91_17295 [Microcoleaceae bacterium UBA11344]|nr:hypothetical protein [Microcoleaceae cyanobacterium UBA11344]
MIQTKKQLQRKYEEIYNMNHQGKEQVWINGKSVPVSYENESGRAITPSNVERDIALGFIGSALFVPVTGLVIVIGRGIRDIRFVYSDLVEDIQTGVIGRRADGKRERIRDVYQKFGGDIDRLVNSNYPEEVKQPAKQALLDNMKEMFKEC